MDPIFLIELGIVAIIVVIQFLVFAKNRQSIKDLSLIYPESKLLNTQTVFLGDEEGQDSGNATQQSIDLIEEQTRFHPVFRNIINTTNAYLEKNRGEANFEILKEMAEEKVGAKEKSIESNITFPLYIGLLCTFTGVIIGLIKIAMVGVSDAAIQSFIGGVLIGMIGSANGLALTVASNNYFRKGIQERDRNVYDYFTFLRTYILPALPKTTPSPVKTLRENLEAFHQGFEQYQDHMNNSLQETLTIFRDLKGVFQQIRSLEQGLSSMGQFLQANDGLIERQVAYIETYTRKAEEFSQRLGHHFTQVDRKIEQLVDDNLKAIDHSAQAAYMKMDQYLSSLEHGERRAFAEALNKDLNEIRSDVANIQRRSLEINERLLHHVTDGKSAYQSMTEEIRALNARIDKVISGKNAFIDSPTFKFFVVAGTLAFTVGLISGGIYLINLFTT